MTKNGHKHLNLYIARNVYTTAARLILLINHFECTPRLSLRLRLFQYKTGYIQDNRQILKGTDLNFVEYLSRYQERAKFSVREA